MSRVAGSNIAVKTVALSPDTLPFNWSPSKNVARRPSLHRRKWKSLRSRAGENTDTNWLRVGTVVLLTSSRRLVISEVVSPDALE
jgi:hypothetical protein